MARPVKKSTRYKDYDKYVLEASVLDPLCTQYSVSFLTVVTRSSVMILSYAVH